MTCDPQQEEPYFLVQFFVIADSCYHLPAPEVHLLPRVAPGVHSVGPVWTKALISRHFIRFAGKLLDFLPSIENKLGHMVSYWSLLCYGEPGSHHVSFCVVLPAGQEHNGMLEEDRDRQKKKKKR